MRQRTSHATETLLLAISLASLHGAANTQLSPERCGESVSSPHVDTAGLEFIASFESFYAIPTLQTTPGRRVIGFGHPCGATRCLVGRDVVSRTEALQLLKTDVQQFERCVRSFVSVPLDYYQFTALVSFAFNIGCEAFSRSALLRHLQAGDFSGAVAEFERWSRVSGQAVPALQWRRQAEATMFSTCAGSWQLPLPLQSSSTQQQEARDDASSSSVPPDAASNNSNSVPTLTNANASASQDDVNLLNTRILLKGTSCPLEAAHGACKADSHCTKRKGQCKHNAQTCQGHYEQYQCGGPAQRQCCVPPNKDGLDAFRNCMNAHVDPKAPEKGSKEENESTSDPDFACKRMVRNLVFSYESSDEFVYRCVPLMGHYCEKVCRQVGSIFDKTELASLSQDEIDQASPPEDPQFEGVRVASAEPEPPNVLPVLPTEEDDLPFFALALLQSQENERVKAKAKAKARARERARAAARARARGPDIPIANQIGYSLTLTDCKTCLNSGLCRPSPPAKENPSCDPQQNKCADDIWLFGGFDTSCTGRPECCGRAKRTALSEGFDKSKETIVIFHGWQNSGAADGNGEMWIMAMAEAARRKYPAKQIVVIDWGTLSKSGVFGYFGNILKDDDGSAKDVPKVGKYVGGRLADLGADPSKIWGMGHSLGGHGVDGMAEELMRRTNKKTKLAVGMDQASPGFSEADTRRKKNEYYDHTVGVRTSSLSFDNRINDLDIFMRFHDERSQPGCSSLPCNHGYATWVVTYMLLGGKLPGNWDWDQFIDPTKTRYLVVMNNGPLYKDYGKWRDLCRKFAEHKTSAKPDAWDDISKYEKKPYTPSPDTSAAAMYAYGAFPASAPPSVDNVEFKVYANRFENSVPISRQ